MISIELVVLRLSNHDILFFSNMVKVLQELPYAPFGAQSGQLPVS